MYVYLRNGRVLRFEAANRWAIDDDDETLILRGNRDREIARFRLTGVDGWFYDNEEVVTYTPRDIVSTSSDPRDA